MKTLIAASAIALIAVSASAASLERVGAKVTGENTFIPAIRVVTEGGTDTITTEDYAKGRAIDATVLPAGSFNPAYLPSALAYVRANYDGPVHVQVGGDADDHTNF